MAESAIIHVNIIDYAAALAQARDRTLSRYPFVIAMQHTRTPVVLCPSRLARKEGIERGMSVATAQRQVPNLRILDPDSRLISQADQVLSSLITPYSPAVYSESGGHLYLDMRGTSRLLGSPVSSALRLQREIQEELGTAAAVAVAPNKLIAKIATRTIRPSGLVAVPPDAGQTFLAPQELRLLSGIGPALSTLLAAAGITQIGELATLSDSEVLALLGKRGLALKDRALGLDTTPFLPHCGAGRTITRSEYFGEPIGDPNRCLSVLRAALCDAAHQMRSEALGAAEIRLSVCYSDRKSESARRTTASQWVADHSLLAELPPLFAKAVSRRVRLLSYTLTLAQLRPTVGQYDLFIPQKEERQQQVQKSIDRVRARYGSTSVLPASALCYDH